MKKSKITHLIFFLVSVFCLYFFIPLEINSNISGQDVYAKELRKMSLKERRESYLAGNTSVYKTDKNIKILIVPGHNDDSWGAEFDGVKEVDLNRELANNLYSLLKQEKGLTIAITDQGDGYTTTFEKFFKKYEDDIEDFIEDSKDSFKEKVEEGDINFEETDFHNKAPEDVAFRLYGINMWADKNDFDLVIHVHFNDYPGRYRDKSPKYNGFAIYIPEKQFVNSKDSREFAEKVFERMSKYFPVSNLKQESAGIVENQELIAIGSNETLKAASMLIEYGYIYEPQFTNPDIRSSAIKDLAMQTYLGVKDYFGEDVVIKDRYLYLEDLYKKDLYWTLPNYNLQKELAKQGYYPPKGKTLNDCPISGYFGECTNEAVKDFQKANNLPSTGFVGDMTRTILNSL